MSSTSPPLPSPPKVRCQESVGYETTVSIVANEFDERKIDTADKAVQKDAMKMIATTSSKNTEKDDAEDILRVMRKSPLTGDWVLFLKGGFKKKPSQMKRKKSVDVRKVGAESPNVLCCPFCGKNDKEKFPKVGDILRFDCDGGWKRDWSIAGSSGPWLLRCVRNIFPVISLPQKYYEDDGHDEGFYHSGGASKDDPSLFYREVSAVGHSEVIIEYPEHNVCMGNAKDARGIEILLECLIRRGKDLQKQPNVRYISFFKQHKCGSIIHAHTQIITTPFIPNSVKRRAIRAKYLYDRHKCSVVRRSLVVDPENAAKGRFVYGSKHFVVSVPFCSEILNTLLIAPRRHSSDFLTLSDEERKDLAKVMRLCASLYYDFLDDLPYNFTIFTCPAKFRDDEEREIWKQFHWYAGFFPYRRGGPSGFIAATDVDSCKELPEEWARRFRGWLHQRRDSLGDKKSAE